VQLKELLSIDFADDHPALAGWNPPEDGGRWAIAGRSSVTLPKPDTTGDLVLLVTVDPFVFPPVLNRQSLRIKINGTILRAALICYRTVLACRIDPAMLTGPEIEIGFEHPDMVRPAMISASTDQREYSVALRALALLETPRGAAPVERPAQPPAAAILPPVAGLSDAELVQYFTSIGDNCEFGLMQRRAGAEPMDLLRFAGVPFDGLVRGITGGFAGIDDCDAAEYQIREGGGVREYVLNIRQFGLQSHTGVHEGEMPAIRLVSREVKKFRVLRRLFTADLASGNRIFVYKRNDPPPEADLRKLAAALRDHGPGTLLAVSLADAAHRPGTVEWAGEGLLRGYIDRLNPYDDATRPSSAHWEDICRQAYTLWRESRAISRKNLESVTA